MWARMFAATKPRAMVLAVPAILIALASFGVAGSPPAAGGEKLVLVCQLTRVTWNGEAETLSDNPVKDPNSLPFTLNFDPKRSVIIIDPDDDSWSIPVKITESKIEWSINSPRAPTPQVLNVTIDRNSGSYLEQRHYLRNGAERDLIGMCRAAQRAF